MKSSKNWFIAGLVIALAICLWFLLQPDKPVDSHATDYAIVQGDNKILLKQRDSGLRIIDSLKKGIVKRDTLIKTTKAERDYYRRDLDKSVSKMVRLTNALTDTLDMYKAVLNDQSFVWVEGLKLDSITNEAQNLAFLYDQYKAHADSLQSLVDSNNVDYVKALEERRRMYDELYVKYEQLYRLYDALFKDHQQAGKKLRREKLKTKVAAVLGGALAVLELLK